MTVEGSVVGVICESLKSSVPQTAVVAQSVVKN
jgi:hypothetical protein